MNGVRSDDEHLDPETFVDLLDGTPVDASCRQHLEGCSRCRGELDELRQTWALVRTGSVAGAGPVESLRNRRRWTPWLAAAAAVVVALLGSLRFFDPLCDLFFGGGAEGHSAAVIEPLLPPMDQDGEFQLLVALSEAFGEEWAPEGVGAFVAEALDPADLTPEQRQRFVEELTEELRSSAS